MSRSRAGGERVSVLACTGIHKSIFDAMSNSSNPRPPEDHEELVQMDDSVIGRAVRRSFLAILLVAAIGGGVIWAMKRKPPAPPSQVTQLTAPSLRERAVPEIPTVKFTDVSAASGIAFRHYNGAYGEKLLPETMGSGVAFFDMAG